MLTITAPEKFVLTLQSIPPFLIENILAFALAVLLAVPLIARLQPLFGNRDSCVKSPDPINNPSRRLRHRSRHIIMKYPSSMVTTSQSNQSLQLNANNSFRDLKQSLKSSTSVPFTDQSQDLAEDETQENGENDGDPMSDDNPIMNNANYEYKYYRDKLIKENLKKQYGHRQPPGNFIFNSIHLSSIDSQKGMRHSDKYNHTQFNSIVPIDLNDKIYINRQVKDIDQRGYFLTQKCNERVETVERGMGTVRSSAEVDKLPEMIGKKEYASTSTGSHRNIRPQRTKKEKLSNENSDSNNTITSKIESAEINSQPSSPKTIIGRSLNRSGTPRSPLKPKIPVESEVLIEFNPSPAHESVEKPSDIPEQTQEQLNDSQNLSCTVETPVAVTVGKNEKLPSHVSSVIGKCSSMASSEAFSTSSSKNPERRPINTRPGSSSGGGGSRPFRNLMPRVNSRPRSSGALPDWDVPEIKDSISPHGKLIETKIMASNAKRPKSANTTVNRKKSEVLSVLESIMDLSCEATIDFQESTVDMDIKKFREMSDDIESTNATRKNVRGQIEENSCVMSIASVKKTKLPISLSNQKRTKSNSKSTIDGKEAKTFLLARSGNYNNSAATGQNRKKNNN